MAQKKLFIVLIVIYSSTSFALNKGAPWTGSDLRGFQCRGKAQGPGPYDYTMHRNSPDLHLVERFHFTPNIEHLISGNSGRLPAELDYTLRASPNHHKALLSIIRYQLKLNNNIRSKAISGPLLTPVECYFQRAIKFRTKDAAIISLYAHYLKKIKQLKKSSDFFEKALRIDPNNSKIHYSYSLLLIKLKQYDKAVIHAKKAYELGNPPQSLKNKLNKLNKWN